MAGSTVTVQANMSDTISSTGSATTSNGCEDQQPADVTSNLSSPTLRTSLSWKSFRSTMSFSEKTLSHIGWSITLLSVLLTVIALSPAFKSQDMSQKALKLAEWTALKDYIEECREELAAGLESQACLRAIHAELPPPPYVKPGILDKARRAWLPSRTETNGTSRRLQNTHRDVRVPGFIQALVFLAIILTACVFAFLSFETNRSRVRRRTYPQTLEGPEEQPELPVSLASDMATATTSLHRPSLPPGTSVRRRIVRTHPIYQHSSLGAAIHHGNTEEIRMRLRNGEDVSQDWPYFIYKLAIAPPGANTPKLMEIARLFLDFGADVNALKGWNGQSALMIAVHFGNVDVAKLLITNGASVSYSSPDSNLTALHRVARLAVTGSAEHAIEIMRLLFDYGADPNQTDRVGETALHKLLIDAGLKRDNAGCMEKLTPVALCLVEHGAHMPHAIKEKYVIGNPIWEIVHNAILKTEWAVHVGAERGSPQAESVTVPLGKATVGQELYLGNVDNAWT